MSVVTLQILIGHPDSFHAGIWPMHALCLFENSRSSWVPAQLLMVYLYAVRDEGVRAAAPRSPDDVHTRRDLAAATTAPERTVLRGACRASRYVREVDGWKGGIVRRGSL